MVIRRRANITGPAVAFVTTTVRDWSPVFSHSEAAESTINQLGETLNHFHVSLIGYVLMPTHFHGLLGFPRIEQLSRFMQSFKSLSSRRIKCCDLSKLNKYVISKDRFSLWMPRFDDVIITSEEQFNVKLRYIHENPLRANLVANAADWRYSSAGDWGCGKPGLLTIDKNCRWLQVEG